MTTFRFTLYVTGETARSQRAVANLRRIGEEALSGAYELTVVDVLRDPERAEEARVLATPTLIKEDPPPVRRVIGDLADTDRVLFGLDLSKTNGSGAES